ncbi:SulP family inorganic anion transporter [Actinocorallia sp. A-T 12471]|uniref:SulP family inorganic anion transporter n=1 Tax=Actinocorallia sp. A-T 12471 TaxID=3089813 RepID=UPI0029CB0688|nr:SulP family inorganic anion transporter [Actinocorallia sp. A-T 12471]MDX6740153.1 SulP family inorganic anion transporter [Actinocorallia sp. A-T 12471]
MASPLTARLRAARALLPGRADLADVRVSPRRDLLAGLTVAIVALPLALGFGVASGLGAEAGLVTAIVAGAVAAIFGGSNLQVSGPTGAMTVVLVPVVHEFGPSGVLTVGLLAGVVLVALALLRAGRYVSYVPLPVIEGFTLGIAAVIALQQIPAALGVTAPDGENVTALAAAAVHGFADAPDWAAPALAVGVAVVMLVGRRWRPGVPFSLLALAAATLAAEALHLPVTRIGMLPTTLPAPSLAFLDPSRLGALLPAAFAVAALAALESLLSATVADKMAGGRRRHDPDRELFGQGLANLAVPLFGGVPATAAIARTAVNVRSGASSRLAALSHALILALTVLAAAPLVARIPLAALAGVLIATAIGMVEAGTMRALARASRPDMAVLVLTAAATLALDLVKAVICGVAIAGALTLRSLARTARLDPSGPADALPGEPIAVYRLRGPLFFATAHRLHTNLTHHPTPQAHPAPAAPNGHAPNGHTAAERAADARDAANGRAADGHTAAAERAVDARDAANGRAADGHTAADAAAERAADGRAADGHADADAERVADAVVIEMSRVSALDPTAAHALGDALAQLEQRGVLVVFAGLRPEHDTILAHLGVADRQRRDGLLFPDVTAALGHARRELAPTPH